MESPLVPPRAMIHKSLCCHDGSGSSLSTGNTSHRRRALLRVLAASAGSWFTGGVAGATPQSQTATTARIVRVGRSRRVTALAEAARLATDDTEVLIDAGDYVGDVASWPQNRLVLRAVDGPVRIIAEGKSAEGKGIWVIKGDDVMVEGIEFTGARVSDRNGAGIRHEGGHLSVRNCRFIDNENGLLTSNERRASVDIEASEFGHNGAGDGQSHNLYAGAIGRLRVTASYFHHARVGHLLKSRAEHSYVAYNRLTDERDGHASYELDFPGAGSVFMIANIVEQSATTENSVMVSFGAEGARWQRNELFMVNNTLANDYANGTVFLRVIAPPTRLVVYNNLLIGKQNAPLQEAGKGDFAGNLAASRNELVAPERYDYRLKKDSHAIGKAVIPRFDVGVDLRPNQEYVHPRQLRELTTGVYSPGAQQTPAG